MLPQDPATPAPHPARDKRRPYTSGRGASPQENLNCAYTFERTDGLPPAQQGVVCCYLALAYCEHVLKDPEFHPSEFFKSVDPRQEDASRLLNLLLDIGHHCRAWHLLPSHRFSDFLLQAFEKLIERKERPWAVYKVFTITHSLALRLRVKAKSGGTPELVVQVYDPNQTRVHTVARVTKPQDWGREGQAHDFLSFLCASDASPSAGERTLASYFTVLGLQRPGAVDLGKERRGRQPVAVHLANHSRESPRATRPGSGPIAPSAGLAASNRWRLCPAAVPLASRAPEAPANVPKRAHPVRCRPGSHEKGRGDRLGLSLAALSPSRHATGAPVHLPWPGQVLFQALRRLPPHHAQVRCLWNVARVLQ
jgi:hypothetical protein